ncbi:MAG: hypothetical protein ABUL58_02945 [Steroidobacter sp.]
MEKFADTLFNIAGISMGLHLICCQIMIWLLRDQRNLLQEYFAIPNEILVRGSNISIRLLRVRYYWPWTSSVSMSSQLDLSSRIISVLARITGLLVPLAFTVYLFVMFSQTS